MMSFIKGFLGFLVALVMGVIMNAHAHSLEDGKKVNPIQIEGRK